MNNKNYKNECLLIEIILWRKSFSVLVSFNFFVHLDIM